ncbi:MAG: 4Fe-4S dicluster domain-containing protein [Oscillospiraceae bacterium]|nr:4Fe-4S dicluster domain-containing protein [Oscillospiraceae bacterium]
MKYVFNLNFDRCVACGACAVACMDQNDISLKDGEKPFRSVVAVERPGDPKREITYLSMGCMHCANAPCIPACPVGCLKKNEMGLTVYDTSACIGCHSCAMACPFGAPTFHPDGKMAKCDGCQLRLEHGMLPACVRACPTGALTCMPEEEYLRQRREHTMQAIANKL